MIQPATCDTCKHRQVYTCQYQRPTCRLDRPEIIDGRGCNQWAKREESK